MALSQRMAAPIIARIMEIDRASEGLLRVDRRR
jgi:hypothetical protein